MPLSTATATRLEKAATDNGFDVERPADGDWLSWSSTQVPLRMWLSSVRDALFLVALSQGNVLRALSDQGTPFSNPLPAGAVGALGVHSVPALDRLVRRAFQLARTLPDGLLRAFEKRSADLPRSTEAERLVVQRVGQDVFREGLLDYWEARCAVTGLDVVELLRASHVKPWADCATDAERLDVFNGLLLAPHLDAAFDRGFVTFADDGALIASSALSLATCAVLGLTAPARLRRVEDGHRAWLRWHREHVFRR